MGVTAACKRVEYKCFNSDVTCRIVNGQWIILILNSAHSHVPHDAWQMSRATGTSQPPIRDPVVHVTKDALSAQTRSSVFLSVSSESGEFNICDMKLWIVRPRLTIIIR